MTLPEDYLSIDTPENVAFGYDVAGIGSRFLAALVDTLLIVVLQLVVNLTLLFLALSFFDEALSNDTSLFLWLGAVFGLVAFVFLWGYYILFEMLWNGQSPGKRWVGLRVIRADGTPVTLVESIIRNLVRLIDFLPAYYGVGVVAMFIDGQARRLGDLAAGTLVVRDRAVITLESLKSDSPPAGAVYTESDSTRALPLERLTNDDLQMVEDYLRRRATLSNRPALIERLVQALFERMDLPVPQMQWHETEDLLAEIVRASRNRRSD